MLFSAGVGGQNLKLGHQNRKCGLNDGHSTQESYRTQCCDQAYRHKSTHIRDHSMRPERAENRVSGSRAANGHFRKRLSGSVAGRTGSKAGAERG